MKECQVNRELELESARCVAKSLERLVTTQQIMGVVAKNTALKSAGLLGQELLMNAVIAVRKLSLLNRRIKSFVIMNAETMTIKTGPRKVLRLGKAMGQVTRQFTSGLIDIMKSQANVSIVVSQKLLNGLMFQVNIIVKEMIGLDCVSPATFTMTDTIRHLYVTSDEKYVDVVRKRYHKFVTGGEDGWEKATPAVE